jgi:hypothetical protein
MGRKRKRDDEDEFERFWRDDLYVSTLFAGLYFYFLDRWNFVLDPLFNPLFICFGSFI